VSERAPFREELERLEAIVRQLEDGETDLDRALQLFEEGVRRLQAARDLLRQSELTVKQVLEDADGTLRTGPIDG
jgi:exodeoxyribonuclease VII small subunit